MRSAECGVRSAECGVRNAECGMRSAEWGVDGGDEVDVMASARGRRGGLDGRVGLVGVGWTGRIWWTGRPPPRQAGCRRAVSSHRTPGGRRVCCLGGERLGGWKPPPRQILGAQPSRYWRLTRAEAASLPLAFMLGPSQSRGWPSPMRWATQPRRMTSLR